MNWLSAEYSKFRHKADETVTQPRYTLTFVPFGKCLPVIPAASKHGDSPSARGVRIRNDLDGFIVSKNAVASVGCGRATKLQ